MEAVRHMMGTRVGTRVSCHSVHGQKQAALTSGPISVGPVHSALSSPPSLTPANPFRPLPIPPPPTTMVAHSWVEYEIGLTWWVWCGELLGHGEPGARPGAGRGPSICAHVQGGGRGCRAAIHAHGRSTVRMTQMCGFDSGSHGGLHRGACTGG